MNTKQPFIDYQNLFHRVAAPCMVLNKDLRFVEMNDAYLSMVQRTRGELLGQFVFDAFPESETRRQHMEKAFKDAFAGKENIVEDMLFSIEVPSENGNRTQDFWWTTHQTPIAAADGTIAFVVQHSRNVTGRVEAQKMKDVIAGELQHRVGNLLNIVLTIARQTARNSQDMDAFLSGFESRLTSISRTHMALTGGNWNGLTLRQLAEQELHVYDHEHHDNITLDGPDLNLSAMEAQAVSMALHELATNAAKYGALKQVEGKLRVSWKTNATNGYDIEWYESDLIDIKEPGKLGFGTMILTRILPSQLNGEAVREFTPTSHLYRLSVPERKTWAK